MWQPFLCLSQRDEARMLARKTRQMCLICSDYCSHSQETSWLWKWQHPGFFFFFFPHTCAPWVTLRSTMTKSSEKSPRIPAASAVFAVFLMVEKVIICLYCSLLNVFSILAAGNYKIVNTLNPNTSVLKLPTFELKLGEMKNSKLHDPNLGI